MTLIILYVLTFAIFLGLDFLGLSYLIKPVILARRVTGVEAPRRRAP